ncbi:MAG: helix-turn-helix domain-containing protein [Planctomycetales bacterium]|nr:helix-turn-helix domain-containing protein [Planctomycetales bacterium]
MRLDPRPVLWTVEDVAEILHLQPAAVRALAYGRKVPGFRVGKRWLFRPEDVEAWLADRAASGRARTLFPVRSRGRPCSAAESEDE